MHRFGDAALHWSPSRAYLARPVEVNRLNVVESQRANSGQALSSVRYLPEKYAPQLEASEHWWFWPTASKELVIAIFNRTDWPGAISGIAFNLYREQCSASKDAEKDLRRGGSSGYAAVKNVERGPADSANSPSNLLIGVED
jgi:hypothetical protein